MLRWVVCLSGLGLIGLGPQVVESAVVAQYDFSTYAPGSGDAAGPPSALNATPYYLFDVAGSGLIYDTNPNVRQAPPAYDLSSHARHLYHSERVFTTSYTTPTSSNQHTRWATSDIAGGGSGDVGLYVQNATSGIPVSNDLFVPSEFTGGFTVEFDIEVDRTNAFSALVSLIRLPGIFISMEGGSNSISATIEGTFAEKVQATTSILKSTTPGAPRPEHTVTLMYDPDHTMHPTNTLFLFIDGQLEGSRNAPGIRNGNDTPVTTSQRLAIFGSNINGIGEASGIMIKNLTVTDTVPEPTAALGVAVLGLVLLRRQRRGV